MIPAVYQRLKADGEWVTVDPEDIPHYRSRGQDIRALGVIGDKQLANPARFIAVTSFIKQAFRDFDECRAAGAQIADNAAQAILELDGHHFGDVTNMVDYESGRAAYERKMALALRADEAIRCWTLVEALRTTEGAGVTICADNGDFGEPNVAIEVCADWTNWEVARFPGETVRKCLEEACKRAGIPT